MTKEVSNFLNKKTPLQYFAHLLKEAKKTSLRVPEAFVLSTVSERNTPNSRVLLLKEITAKGLIFYTNYESQKGHEMAKNSNIAMNFFWDPLWQQVKWLGKVKKISRAESEAYWATRPRESQLSQWVSLQSQPVASRKIMDNQLTAARKQFENKKIPCPKKWGGYILIPSYVEFWVGRDGRFHDRYTYQKVENKWVGKRLYP